MKEFIRFLQRSEVHLLYKRLTRMLAKFHIAQQVREGLQCSICFEYDYQLLECQGPCQKRLCRVCSRLHHYKECPFCQESLKVDYLPPRKDKLFHCPKGCSDSLLFTQQEFYQHGKSCEFNKYHYLDLTNQYIYREQYKCDNGHLLRFPLHKTECSHCGQYHYTSNCRPCGVKICTTCRPPPCSKKQCPLGHDFVHNTSSGSVICDLCGISLGGMSTKSVYGDRNCNFDICQACYNKQPEEHPQPNYRNEEVVRRDNQDLQNDWYGWGRPLRANENLRILGTIEPPVVADAPEPNIIEVDWVPVVQHIQDTEQNNDDNENGEENESD